MGCSGEVPWILYRKYIDNEVAYLVDFSYYRKNDIEEEIEEVEEEIEENVWGNKKVFLNLKRRREINISYY